MTTPMQDLYKETGAARALLVELARLTAEPDDEIAATAIEGETNLVEAIKNGFDRIEMLGLMVDALGAKIQAFVSRRERLQSQAASLRHAIGVAMSAGQMRKLELSSATLSLRAVPAKCEVVDEEAVPAEWWRPQPKKLDKAGLRKALTNGLSVPGVQLVPSPDALWINQK